MFKNIDLKKRCSRKSFLYCQLISSHFRCVCCASLWQLVHIRTSALLRFFRMQLLEFQFAKLPANLVSNPASPKEWPNFQKNNSQRTMRLLSVRCFFFDFAFLCFAFQFSFRIAGSVHCWLQAQGKTAHKATETDPASTDGCVSFGISINEITT